MNIAFIIIGILALIGGVIWLVLQESKAGKISSIAIGAAGVALFFLGCSFTIVKTGQVGVPYNMGQIGTEVRQPGWAWHVPFIEKVEKVNVKMQDEDLAKDPGLWAECSDKLPIQVNDIRVTYQINPDSVLWLKSNSSIGDTVTFATSIQSALENATVQFDAIKVVNRSLLEPAIREALQKSTDEKYGAGRIQVVRVLVGKIEYEESYITAINNKTVAQQAAEQQAVENKKNIDKATAEGESKKIQAQADADALLIRADAEAAANKKIADSLSALIIAEKWVVKWDGKMPIVTDSGGNIVDIGSIIEGLK